ncbi:hypothetical protein H4R35_004540, partial [Dimargaris xerosporica]
IENGNLAISVNQMTPMTQLNLQPLISQGEVRACIKAGSSSGVVTAFSMIGGNGDQVGFEWQGKIPGRVDTVFLVEDQYVDGITPQSFDVRNGDASADYSIYALKFTDQKINYYVDDVLIYTVKNKNDGKFPLGANQLAIGIWDDNYSRSTKEATDYSKVEDITAYFDWIEVTLYCNGRKSETMPSSAVIAEGELIPKAYVPLCHVIT